jgi:hypothetical protein
VIIRGKRRKPIFGNIIFFEHIIYLKCFKKSFLPPDTFRLINQIRFFIQGLCKNGGPKFISKALAQINPQNELGNIISEPGV